jgi:hypothetical protein
MYNNNTYQIMKINSKNKVCVGILATVITSIIFMANAGFTKLAQGMSMNMSMKAPAKMSNMSMNAPMCTTTTVPVAGALNKTYTIPKGFSGKPTTANGNPIVDNHQS